MTIFEKIIQGDIPSYKIHEDDIAYSFLDANPHNRGHVLVIPKKPYEIFTDIPDDELQHIILIVKKIAINIQKELNADGYNIVINNGEDAEQEIPHAHFHIIPRFKGDNKLYRERVNLGLEDSEFKILQERLSL